MVDVNLDGTTTVTNFLSQAGVVPEPRKVKETHATSSVVIFEEAAEALSTAERRSAFARLLLCGRE
jgi:hypothetical protein